RGILHSQDLRRSRAKVRVGGMSAPETIGHPSHASENPRRSRLLWSHLEKVRSFRMNQKFWSEPGAEAMLQLRADYLSETDPMDTFWEDRQGTATGRRPYRRAV